MVGDSLLGQKTEVIKRDPIPTALVDKPWVVGTDVARHWQGLPNLVNIPVTRVRAFPGQHLSFAIGAKGDGRDQLLKDGTYSFTVVFNGAPRSFENVHPAHIHQIKAEGADFVLSALNAASINSKEARAMISMVSLADFDLDWCVPLDAKDGTVTFGGKVSWSNGKSQSFTGTPVEIWSFDRVVKDGGFKNLDEGGEWMMTYYQHPEPSRLLHILRLSKEDQNAFKPNIMGFYTEVLKSDPDAAKDLMTRLKGEGQVTRLYGMVLLKEAGYDLSALLAALPENEQEAFKLLPTKLPPLPDPYDLIPSVEDPQKVPTRMDMLWSQFLATGDAKPVRAIASVLQWKDEGMAFLEIRKSGKKVEKVTPEMVKGLAYMASGWSLGSFYRHHPLVTDYIEAWKQDVTVPQVVREQLGTLLSNEAFKKD